MEDNNIKKPINESKFNIIAIITAICIATSMLIMFGPKII